MMRKKYGKYRTNDDAINSMGMKMSLAKDPHSFGKSNISINKGSILSTFILSNILV